MSSVSDHYKSIFVLGTARNDSNTLKAYLSNPPFANSEVIELHKLRINPYRYETQERDDFLRVIEKMIESEIIVFATPVYWYAMSGTLKIFFDRFTDLITKEKRLGRALAGKDTYLFATGSDPELPLGFETPFKLTSDYFGMNYQTSFYVCTKSW